MSVGQDVVDVGGLVDVVIGPRWQFDRYGQICLFAVVLTILASQFDMFNICVAES